MEDSTPSKGPIDSSKISAEDAKAASMQMLDNEFEIEVAGKNQVFGRWAVDAERARYAGTEHSTPLSTRGMYTLPHTQEGPGMPVEYPAGKMGEYDVFLPGESDTVWAIGVGGQANTYAHEFRHRAFTQTEIRALFDPEEKINRVLDGAYASSAEDWTRAVGLWQDQIHREDGEEPSMLEAESSLVQELQDREDDIIEYEQAYLDHVGKPFAVPTVQGWFGPKKGSLKKARKGDFPLPWKRFLPAAEQRRNNKMVFDAAQKDTEQESQE